MSVQVLQEFHVTVTRKVSQPLSPQESAHVIRDLSAWHVYTPAAADVLAAIELQERFQVSFWDAMIIRSAIQLDCPILWSEDLNSGQHYAGIDGATQIQNPFE